MSSTYSIILQPCSRYGKLGDHINHLSIYAYFELLLCSRSTQQDNKWHENVIKTKQVEYFVKVIRRIGNESEVEIMANSLTSAPNHILSIHKLRNEKLPPSKNEKKRPDDWTILYFDELQEANEFLNIATQHIFDEFLQITSKIKEDDILINNIKVSDDNSIDMCDFLTK
ncbi:hypothetical protein [Trichoplusia ni ascovirus 2c]|uniref:hypothetical protein n=1 Tax=Trichoplusia ni ascovirus 2c TaxID=328615 RepID=UPI0000E441F7|nr:hypothetical protein TNAV2c_gp031 [Trichoplusia ni ascovirus 2c]ABF70548.1 hypothetical protein [Trichoplusia ni ascovirus 2c]AUS94133.1 hypothetical protein [Trichoplusia ni ascovirus 6b]